MKLRKKLNCATSEACYLTIRSSRWRFTATFFYGKFLFYCGRAAPRLNSGVRLRLQAFRRVKFTRRKLKLARLAQLIPAFDVELISERMTLVVPALRYIGFAGFDLCKARRASVLFACNRAYRICEVGSHSSSRSQPNNSFKPTALRGLIGVCVCRSAAA